MADFVVPIYLSALLCFLVTLCSAADTIPVNQPLKDGDSIVSADGRFELGFFSPGSSKNRYVGIRYKKIATGTVVWVVNRDSPLNNTQGQLLLNDQGTLLLFNGDRNITCYSNSLVLESNNPVAQLLDTGNLVIRNGNDDHGPDNILWQSFDFMGDTFLPGAKLGVDLTTGLNRYVTSWKSFDDPSTGNYSNRLDPVGVPQFYLYEGSVVRFRGGHWNGLRFAGMPNLKPNPIYTFEFVWNEKEIYYKYDLINSSVLSRMAISPDGVFQRFTWVDRTQGWFLYLSANTDNCDRYALCGAHGVCDIRNSPACDCLYGFVPRYPQDWAAADWSHGCVRNVPLDCGEGEGFLKYSGIKLPDTRRSWYNKSMNLDVCRETCLKNCSCTAYASWDVRNGGSGCILWFDDLIDIREYDENGQDIYIRMAASEIEAYNTSEGNKLLRKILIPVLSFGLSALCLCLVLFLLMRRRKQTRRVTAILPYNSPQHAHMSESAHEDLELPLFDFGIIIDATNGFSDDNKLGQGGFGTVYKGILDGRQEIAVKRLSKKSRQGIVEFKNEVLCISKLQHRNLVKLLGSCIEQEERLLIYEYMPNKSLDSFIFDQEKSELLDWQKRFLIITGIARGLLYLHQDSRLRIIHRDLKASNILLDDDLNPKISDFGMARSFGGDETEANTHRVVGTYGYMSPEYAIDGLFSIKSDVFSFGVLVLEIVSGKRNRRFCHPEHKLNLLGHAWKLYNESRASELVDSTLRSSCDTSEVLRTIQIGLLCVQQSPEVRPRMPNVVLMLSSDIALPQPKKPGFFAERSLVDDDSSSSYAEAFSTNGLTVTAIEPR